MENPNFGKNRSLLSQRLGRDVTGLVKQYIEHQNVPRIRSAMNSIVKIVLPTLINSELSLPIDHVTEYLTQKYLEQHGPTCKSFLENALFHGELEYNDGYETGLVSILRYLFPNNDDICTYEWIEEHLGESFLYETFKIYQGLLIEMAMEEGMMPEGTNDQMLNASEGYLHSNTLKNRPNVTIEETHHLMHVMICSFVNPYLAMARDDSG